MNIGLFWVASIGGMLSSGLSVPDYVSTVYPTATVYRLASRGYATVASVPSGRSRLRRWPSDSPARRTIRYVGRPAAYLHSSTRSLSLWSKAIRPYFRASFPPVAVLKPINLPEQGKLIVARSHPSSLNPFRSPLPPAAVSEKQCIRWQHKPLPASSFSTPPASSQVWVEGQLVAELPTLSQANRLAHQLKQAFQTKEFDPYILEPDLLGQQAIGRSGQLVVFRVDESLSKMLGRDGDLIAIAWVNNLRRAMDIAPLDLTEAQTRMYDLVQTDELVEGIASWYGPYFHGRLTAAGEVFDQNELTAAHPSLPFNTYLKVTNVLNGYSIIVRINDRGPYVGIRSLDLSRKAARCLDSEYHGVVPYTAVIMRPHAPVLAGKMNSQKRGIRSDQKMASQP